MSIAGNGLGLNLFNAAFIYQGDGIWAYDVIYKLLKEI